MFEVTLEECKVGKSFTCLALHVKVKADPHSLLCGDVWPAMEDGSLHPFYRLVQMSVDNNDQEDLERLRRGEFSVIVGDNPITRAIIAELQKPLEQMKSGSTSPDDYRALLLHVLDQLWD